MLRQAWKICRPKGSRIPTSRSPFKRSAQGALNCVARGSDLMTPVAERMSGLTDYSLKVSEVACVIANIALQTSTRALNAVVEAARAGE
ncbi:methyl-accepting chemotaxis protein [Paraburkholderia sp. SIMBA_030]|uniref:methyl-accepting chemotaxis protein n=1 Tax=Paraburkholderia sp. SIMBA_030 TaxID=3085773 RepID=UPI00397E223B